MAPAVGTLSSNHPPAKLLHPFPTPSAPGPPPYRISRPFIDSVSRFSSVRFHSVAAIPWLLLVYRRKLIKQQTESDSPGKQRGYWVGDLELKLGALPYNDIRKLPIDGKLWCALSQLQLAAPFQFQHGKNNECGIAGKLNLGNESNQWKLNC